MLFITRMSEKNRGNICGKARPFVATTVCHTWSGGPVAAVDHLWCNSTKYYTLDAKCECRIYLNRDQVFISYK